MKTGNLSKDFNRSPTISSKICPGIKKKYRSKIWHYYGLWTYLRFLGYLYSYAQFDYLHCLFCKLGVNSLNMKDFTLFIPFTLNVSVNGVNMTIVYIIDDLYGVDISLPSVQSVNGVNKIIWISEDD